ncbi:PREDICTED: methionine synthase reductase isoform X2 [Papilio xuthus]|uniref:Methionine synthase reductase isoform X2 n=1 Tax=Papilio xuthus TaxID=66420 RepID=A0AAJ6ZIF7_PAPXU|nr:PREDICTED: methionine synthase reductase isoform X2 [Papilio xuthus]
MVVLHNLQDVFLEASRQATLNLPTLKQNYLKIDFGNFDIKETVYNGAEPSLPFAASSIINAGINNWKRLTADHEDCKAVYEVTFDVMLFLLALSRYTKDETEKKVLEYLCSKEGSISYTNYILNKNLCMLDLFEIFKTCKPPVEVILEHLPRLLPRPYSIVNSSLINPNEIKICFSVMNIGYNRKGLVTGWLESLINESLEDKMRNITITDKKETMMDKKVSIYLRKNINQFSFPDKISRPMILIGPGTGVAPYIGFLEEQMKEEERDGHIIWLFFGCRYPDLDFIYKDELHDFKDSGVLTKLTTVFSRFNDCEDKYIQDAILSNGKEVSELLKNGALVYVCGDVKTMATQVTESFVKCLVNFSDLTQEDAEKFVCDMQKEKTYLIDLWN